MRKDIILLFLILFLAPLISAGDNVGTQGEDVNIIVFPSVNASIASVTTNITVDDPDGINLIAFQVMTKDLTTQRFNYTLVGANTTKQGIYDCTAFAFSDSATDQSFSCSFEVNPSGKSYIPQIAGPLIFGAILLLMFISLLLFIFAARVDIFPAKVFLVVMAGVIAVLNIGFVTASFQEFFSINSGLSGSLGVLYITFIILITGFSIFLLIYLIVVGLRLYNVKRGLFVEGL